MTVIPTLNANVRRCHTLEVSFNAEDVLAWSPALRRAFHQTLTVLLASTRANWGMGPSLPKTRGFRVTRSGGGEGGERGLIDAVMEHFQALDSNSNKQ